MSDLAYRYGMPSRTNRLVATVMVGALVAGAFGFVGWTVLFHGTPEVQSQVRTFEVVSDHEAQVSLEVHREHRTTEAACGVQALAADHAVVGESRFPVTDGDEDQVLSVTVRTDRRATVVTSLGCTTADQRRPR